MNPSIKIIILNWNGSALLKSCLNSIMKIDYDNYSTVVIDNDSIDDSCSMVDENFPKVQLFKLDTNFGYAKGYNEYFETNEFNESDFILLLNNDTEVTSNILNSFVIALSKYGANSIFGSKIFYKNKCKKIWYAGGEIKLKYGKISHRGIRKKDGLQYSHPIKTDYVTGCCLFTSPRIIRKLNGFDEKFNMYGEDVDLCLRAKKEGFNIYYWPDAEIYHHVSASIGGNWSLKKIKMKFKSIIRLWFKHYLKKRKIDE